MIRVVLVKRISANLCISFEVLCNVTLNWFMMYLLKAWTCTCLHIAGDRALWAVDNASDCRYVSDCRSRGPELDPDPVLYFRGD